MDEYAFGEFAGEGNNLFVLEGNRAVREREERVVTALLDIFAGMEFGSALADDDFSRVDGFSTEGFDAETF